MVGLCAGGAGDASLVCCGAAKVTQESHHRGVGVARKVRGKLGVNACFCAGARAASRAGLVLEMRKSLWVAA